MSRISKLEVAIPDKIDFSVNENKIKIKGPKGELSRQIPAGVTIAAFGRSLQLCSTPHVKNSVELCGTYRGLIINMIVGVSSGFKKKLELQGVGYKAHLDNNTLILSVGYSHQVFLKLPLGIQIAIENNTNISVLGIDKELVGHMAATIRLVKPPEPYKGKGIRYQGEHIRKKIGKAGKK
ncbi:ribosomal protein L6 (plastid) [Cryptomonas paramecium]|uniref:Ribosomal protein L6 n=1 Tax=Cryptomonas paramaecium TaxID=2898 RepID=D2ISA8_9CRYP|nr:ribosomal protein L6 [Cryptomonas paramecium]ACT46800.1 ribosomal protein L6 [Cryptomonas paramecium]BDA97995.1 ribosomal protein S6 [Cryptomonas paramecium]